MLSTLGCILQKSDFSLWDNGNKNNLTFLGTWRRDGEIVPAINLSGTICQTSTYLNLLTGEGFTDNTTKPTIACPQLINFSRYSKLLVDLNVVQASGGYLEYYIFKNKPVVGSLFPNDNVVLKSAEISIDEATTYNLEFDISSFNGSGYIALRSDYAAVGIDWRITGWRLEK